MEPRSLTSAQSPGARGSSGDIRRSASHDSVSSRHPATSPSATTIQHHSSDVAITPPKGTSAPSGPRFMGDGTSSGAAARGQSTSMRATTATSSSSASSGVSAGLQQGGAAAMNRFKDLGKKVTSATKTIDSFAKTSLSKISTTLGGEHGGEATAAAGTPPHPQRRGGGVPSDSTIDTAATPESSQPGSASSSSSFSSSQSLHHQSPGARTPQDAFKDLGSKVSHAARSAKHKMDALGPALSSEFNKVKSSIKAPHHRDSHGTHEGTGDAVTTGTAVSLGDEGSGAEAFGSDESAAGDRRSVGVRTPEGSNTYRGSGSSRGGPSPGSVTPVDHLQHDDEGSSHQRKSLGKKLKSISHKIIEDGKFIGKNFTKGVVELTDGTIGLHHDPKGESMRKSWPRSSQDADSAAPDHLSQRVLKRGANVHAAGGSVSSPTHLEGGDYMSRLQAPTLQRRVSDVLEIDRDGEEEDGGAEIAPYDQETQEYLSRITRLDALFDPTTSARGHHPGSSSGDLDGSGSHDFSMSTELSQPVSHITLDTAKDWIKKTMHKPRFHGSQSQHHGIGNSGHTSASAASIRRSSSANSLASSNSGGANFAMLPVYEVPGLDVDNSV